MADYIPNINLVHISSTSTNHVIDHGLKSSDSLPRVLEYDCTDLEVNRVTEGLQVDMNGAYPRWEETDTGKQVAYDDNGLIPCEHRIHKEEKEIYGFNRRSFIIVATIITIVLLCAAIGGGVGGYMAHKSRNSNSNSLETIPTSSLTPSGLPQDPPAVTEGISGMAALPCASATIFPSSIPQATPRSLPNPYTSPESLSSNLYTFDITCRRGVPLRGDRDGFLITHIKQFITYTFKDCIDKCAQEKRCWGVTYGANLTEMIGDGDPGANCLLKNGTWDATEPRPLWFASAVRRA